MNLEKKYENLEEIKQKIILEIDKLKELNKLEIKFIKLLISTYQYEQSLHNLNYHTIKNIPLKAYEYVVNGKSAIEWIMESYRIKTDKDSGITDDPNTYGDEKYIFNLLISVISVSLKTLDLIDSMPEYKEI